MPTGASPGGRVLRTPRTGRVVIAGVLAIAVSGSLVLAAVPADAEPPRPVIPSKAQVDAARRAAATKAAQVAAIEGRLAGATDRLDALAREAGRAAEAYNGAVYRLTQARAEATLAADRAAKAQQTLESQRRHVGRFAAALHQGGGDIAQIGPLFTADGPQSLLDSAGTARSVATAMQGSYLRYAATNVVSNAFRLQAEQALARVQAAADEAAAAKRRAEAAHQAQAVAVASIGVERRQLITQLAVLRKTSYQVAELRQRGLEELARRRAAAREAARKAEEARRAEEEARREAEKNKPGKGKPGDNKPGKGKGKPGKGGWRWAANTAIDFAGDQIGEPYVWGAEGPAAWDCSGLTKRAWQRAGVDLPHYSVAQYEQSEPIAEDDLRQGDLVFWSDDPEDPGTIFHVGLYIGDGQMIHAPRAGRPVTIDSIYYWEDPDFFGRVR